MASATLPDDWDSDQAELVGRIVIAFSQLEWVLYLTPKRLRGEQLINYQEWPDNFGVEDRCRQLEAEAPVVLAGAHMEALTALIAGIRAANRRRNDVVHGPWIEAQDGERMIVRDRAGIIFGPGALEALLAEIRKIRESLNTFPWPAATEQQKAQLRHMPKPHHYRKPA